VVPCLYAWINVLANWDPYENTSDIPVAVVNEDTSVELPGKGAICTGDLLVDALADNDKIGWQFMGEDEALEGVRAGRYYAAIVIPDDFTRHLTGVLDGKTDKAHLRYYVNEKVNPIAPKVTDAGASTIESQIDSKFAAKVGEVVAEKIGGALDGLVGDSQGALARGATVLDEVNVSLADVDSKLGGLSSSLRDAQGALGGGETAVIDKAVQYLNMVVMFFIPLLTIFVLRNGLQGLGYSRVAMFAGLFELVGRAFVAFALVGPYGFDGAILANPAAWIMADALLIPVYLHTVRALQQCRAGVPGRVAG
jgi:YhgE/Pip-like protein